MTAQAASGSQSPSRAYSVVRVSIGTGARTIASTFFDLAHVSPGKATIRPSGSIIAEMPIFTARAMLRRVSTARNRPTARCCSCSAVPSNQPSFEMLTKKSTPSAPGRT